MSVNKDANNGLWHVPKSMQGIHIFLYDGDCSNCYFRWNAVVINNTEQGRWIMNVSDQGGVYNTKCYIGIRNIPNPSNYPHNFRLIPIENENNYQDIIFEPTWIKPINNTGFSSMRFMDFLATNNNPISTWSDRTLPTNFTMGNGLGIAWEFVISLTNILNISAWINIPAKADDDYIKNVATLWKNNYKHWGKTKLYIEYSNECWNAIFECHSWMQIMGNLTNQSSYSYYGQRVCEIREIFDNILDSTGNKKTDNMIFMVLGTQEHNSYVTKQEISNHSQCINGVALAAYYCVYNMTQEQQVDASLTTMFNTIESTPNQQFYENLISEHYNISTSYMGHDGKPIGIVGYEGSFGCSPPYGSYRQNLTTLYNEMVVDPRVGDTVKLNLENYFKIVGDDSLINVFSYIGFGGQYGDFGHLEYQDSYYNESLNGRYKFDGIVAYLQSLK
eukprot:146091_1